jgi:taurine dioxygenase
VNLNVGETLGAEVTNLDLANVGAAEIVLLRAVLADHGVVVFRNQDIDDGGFLAFLHKFGRLAFSTGEIPVEGFDDLNLISNVGRSSPPRSTFHVDTSYVRQPPAYTALRAVQVPAHGGETLFSNQYRAYDTLPAAMYDRLVDRTITHVVSGLDLGPDEQSRAEHPVFRPHPLSGRTALYVTTAQRCEAVSGMSRDQAAAVIAELLAHSTRPDNVVRHAWAPGDVVMWDNGCVLHKADHAGVVGDRVMHRGMVASYA